MLLKPWDAAMIKMKTMGMMPRLGAIHGAGCAEICPPDRSRQRWAPKEADRRVPGGFRVVQRGGIEDLQRERAALLSLPDDRGAEHGLIMSARYYGVNPV